ncbi:MAG: SHD1 domain-containing protein [Pirellulales bacterium]
MWKSLRTLVVALTVSTLIISPAAACRWLRHRSHCYQPCMPAYSSPVVYHCQPVSDPCGYATSGCGETVMRHESSPHIAPSEPMAPREPTPLQEESTVNRPADEAPMLPFETRDTFAPPTPVPPARPMPPVPTVTLPELPEEPEDAAAAVGTAVGEAVGEASNEAAEAAADAGEAAGDLFADPPTEIPPGETPVTPLPEAEPMPPADTGDDLFDLVPTEPAPSDPAPVEPAPADPADDLFGEPAAPADPTPGTPPGTEAPAEPTETGDLFGESAEPAPPATEEPAAAVEDSADLFGETAEPLPTTEPASEAPATVEELAPPADDAADLFGDPAMPADPAEELTEEPATETETPVTDPATDDLFGGPAEPADAPAIDAPPVDPAEADLFGTPATDETATPPAEETPAPESDELGNLDAVLQEPGGLASSELRSWNDNTGRYSCRGRMVEMLDGKVRLLKETGRTATVAIHRLSDRDLEFVNRQAAAERGTPTIHQTAQR